MLSINYTELRKDLKKSLDQACEMHELIVVHRPKGKSVVIISLDDYNALNETAYLLSSDKNASRLRESIKQVSEGNLIEFNPDNV
jgi:antitoxin YefM